MEKMSQSSAAASDELPHVQPSTQNGPDLLRRSSTLLPKTGFRSGAARFWRPDRTGTKTQAATTATLPAPPPPPRQKISLDAEEALRMAYLPQEIASCEPDFCDYDSLIPYAIPQDDEKALVVEELRRLTDTLETCDEPMIFDKCRRLAQEGVQGQRAMELLTKLIIEAFRIARFDNDGVSLIIAAVTADPKEYVTTHNKLRRVEPGLFTRWFKDPVAAKQNPIWHTVAELVEDASSIFDFVTEAFARYICQIADGDHWRHRLLGPLAKFSAKVKFILRNYDDSVRCSTRRGDLIEDEYRQMHPDWTPGKKQKRMDAEAIMKNIYDKGGDDSHYGQLVDYCVNQQNIRYGFVMPLGQILEFLLPGGQETGFSRNEYEICGVVMENGFHDFQTFLFQNRDFEFVSTSDRDELNFVHPVFRMLDASIHRLIRDSAPPTHQRLRTAAEEGATPAAASAPSKTIIEWEYMDAASPGTVSSDGSGVSTTATTAASTSSQFRKRRTYELQSLNEVITLLVLLAMAGPTVAASFKMSLDMFYLTCEVSEYVRPFPERSFNVFVRLYTSDFERIRKERLPRDVLQLSQAVHEGLFSRTSLLSTVSTAPAGTAVHAAASHAQQRERERELAKVNEIMSSWVYTESAVVIGCSFYVWTVAVISGILVAGGLVIGVVLGERLEGVDPFNITVYAWALAAFLVLVCKAVMVSDWAWSDFLHGFVKCRSVSEVHAVTGINEQMIIAKLLHDEQESLLKACGPYNALFRHKAADGVSGFSIDVPVMNKTLLLSGLTMLKVETPLGHALVCLDARKGTDVDIVRHRMIVTDKDMLFCADIDRIRRYTRGHEAGELRIPLRSGKLGWRKVDGVYNVLDAAFI